MDSKKSHYNFIDDENDDKSPSFHHLTQIVHNETHFDSESSPLMPQSPESLWCPSPIISTPLQHPSLFSCCISSLHHDGDIFTIAVSKDLVLTGSSSSRIHAWDPLDCHPRGYIRASSGDLRAMVSYNDMLFTSHKDHKIRIWNIKDSSDKFRARKVATLPIVEHFKMFIPKPLAPSQHRSFTPKRINSQHKDKISCMAYYSIEGILYTGSYDRTVKAWRLREKKCVDSFIAHGGNINDMVVTQQNGYLFTCSSDGTIKMWLRVYGEDTHALIKVLCFTTYPIYALALTMSTPRKSFLYSGSSDGSIIFWEQELISCRYNHGGVLQGHQFGVLCLVALKNLVISGSEDSTIRIWRREEGKNSHECLTILEGHKGPVRCLDVLLQKDKFVMSFLVYSASLDQTFKVWRVKLLPEKKNPLVGDVMEESEPSPVLSPSWVEKKLTL